jgi:hypothetical protein
LGILLYMVERGVFVEETTASVSCLDQNHTAKALLVAFSMIPK